MDDVEWMAQDCSEEVGQHIHARYLSVLIRRTVRVGQKLHPGVHAKCPAYHLLFPVEK